ncbi:MAG: hypothetical protein KBF88_17185, partial [Polyangiaceae bacterium]|nr:hypothetical protein [Polyangiaceae bacterium]
PQSHFLAPSFLFTLLFGTLRGEAITAMLMVLVGLEGTYRYLRSRKATPFASLLSAPVFALSGIFAVAPALGWINFFGFELLPWAAFSARQILRGRPLYALVFGVAIAWMIGFGGTYATPFTGLYLAYEVVEFLLEERGGIQEEEPRSRIARLVHWAKRKARIIAKEKWQPLLTLVAAGVFALGLGAVRFFPLVQTLQMAPRIIGGAPGSSPIHLVRALIGIIRPDEGGDFPDNGTFLVGALLIPAVLVGLLRPARALVVLPGWLFLWAATGYGSRPSLFGFLRELPVYEALRYPIRFLTLFALVLSVAAAWGISVAMTRVGKHRFAGGVVIFLSLLMIGNTAWLGLNHHRAIANRPLIAEPERTHREFKQARGTRWAGSVYPYLDRGVLSCYDAYPVPQSPDLRGDLDQEINGEGLEISPRHWSPNKIQFSVKSWTGPEVRRAIVNQNWHPGWFTKEGHAVVNHHGLLAVDVNLTTLSATEKNRITLVFRPKSFVAGLTSSLLALAAAVLLVHRARSKKTVSRKMLMGALVAPLLFGGALLLVLPEPPVPPRDLHTFSGEPIVLDALPEGAKKLEATFHSGIEIVGYKLAIEKAPESERARTGDRVRLEIFWRVGPNVEKKLGIFVHIVPSEGEDLRADHPTVSDVLAFEKAPQGKILRDVMEISMPPEGRTKSWTAYVGLWRVQRGGSRVRIEKTDGATVDANRVQITGFRLD